MLVEVQAVAHLVPGLWIQLFLNELTNLGAKSRFVELARPFFMAGQGIHHRHFRRHPTVQLARQHHQPVVAVTDHQFVGSAHASVHLNGLVADAGSSALNHRQHGMGQPGGFSGVTLLQASSQLAHDGTGFEVSDLHIGEAVLQGLEAAQRHAELLACAQVIAGQFQQVGHQSHRLGAQAAGRQSLYAPQGCFGVVAL
ncbi:hypothetical protein D9M68_710340 [compost metagenome]